MTAELPESSEQQTQRLSFWANVAATNSHIRESVKNEGSRIRKSDPITVWLVPAISILLVGASLIGGWVRFSVALLAFVAVVFYIMARIGIVRSMNQRQTNMVWHLFLAWALAGILFAFAFLDLMRLKGF